MNDLHKSDPNSPWADDMEFVRDYARRNDGYPLVQPVVDFINAHPAPQIIRTPAELGLCDRDDVFAVKWEVESWTGLATAVNNGWPAEPFPAVKVAEGAHLRSCREALEYERKADE